VLIDQTTRRVIVYARTAQGWMIEGLSTDGKVSVPCLEISIGLERVYSGVNFAPVSNSE
jgi:hypothetical protein